MKNPYPIQISNESGMRSSTHAIREILRLALSQSGLEQAQVSILLTGREQIQALNRQYRKVDAPTDVLTFPAAPWAKPMLGDIAICLPIAKEQSILRGVTQREETLFLAVHGLLHLLGMEDESDSGRQSMVTKMNQIATAYGLESDLDWWSRHYGEAAYA